MVSIDYSGVTELPKTSVSEIQLKRSYQRYCFALEHCVGGKIIELGCGGGQGLNLLQDVADEVIGYDIDKTNIGVCKKTYANSEKIKIINGDIENINLGLNTIETIILYETIYYIHNHDRFFNKLYNVLKPNGKIIICTANKNWHSFNPSPFSTNYFDAKELYELGNQHSFRVETFSSFKDEPRNILDLGKKIIKQFAIKYNLIPKTMGAKIFLKFFFSGKIVTMPERFEHGIIEYIPPEKTNPYDIDTNSTAIFAIFTKSIE